MKRLTVSIVVVMTAIFLFVIPSKSFAQAYNPQQCVANLRNLNLEPCTTTGTNNCVELGNATTVHQFCSTQSRYAPLQLIGAKNNSSGETKVIADAQETVSYLKAHPDWVIWQCYCCC